MIECQSLPTFISSEPTAFLYTGANCQHGNREAGWVCSNRQNVKDGHRHSRCRRRSGISDCQLSIPEAASSWRRHYRATSWHRVSCRIDHRKITGCHRQNLMEYSYLPGQIILGKFGGKFLGYLDDRPMVTIAGARAGKTSTILEPNLYLYPGSMIVLDPKCELASTASLRAALGIRSTCSIHSASRGRRALASTHLLNSIPRAGPSSMTSPRSPMRSSLMTATRARSIGSTAHALLLLGIILLTLTLPRSERHLITVRELLLLTNPRMVMAMKARPKINRRQ